ncbi:N-acetyltransferase [Acanthamoeba castellanii mamavirus]|nr:N-acetyltransferase [Acanthamoeba castellanii mamavirus]EJN41219.1 hypothetical protein lvs_R108 [Acanthamoeba polyphaga lentillevirus]
MSNLSSLKKLMVGFLSRHNFSNRDYFSGETYLRTFDHYTIIDKVYTTKYGICMELNYVFHIILTNHHIPNYLVKCHKKKSNGDFYDLFHLAIIVELDGSKYFIDVGFGEHFIEPVELNHNSITGNIKVIFNQLENTNISTYDISTNNMNNSVLILRVTDKPLNNIKHIESNYQKFFHSKPEEFPLCRVLFERKFDAKTNQYIPLVPDYQYIKKANY